MTNPTSDDITRLLADATINVDPLASNRMQLVQRLLQAAQMIINDSEPPAAAQAKPAEPQFEKGEWVYAPAGEHFPNFIGIYVETTGDCAIGDRVTGEYRGKPFFRPLSNLRRATNTEVEKALALKPGDIVKPWRNGIHSDEITSRECKVIGRDPNSYSVIVDVGDGKQWVSAYDLHLVSRAADKPAVRLYQARDVVTCNGEPYIVSHYQEEGPASMYVYGHKYGGNLAALPVKELTLILAADAK